MEMEASLSTHQDFEQHLQWIGGSLEEIKKGMFDVQHAIGQVSCQMIHLTKINKFSKMQE